MVMPGHLEGGEKINASYQTNYLYKKNKRRKLKMNDLQIILSFTGTVLGLLITIITFIVKFVRSAKAKRGLEQTLKVSNAVLSFIREAEKFTAFSGEEKKAFVMTKACQYAINNKIKFFEEDISEKVEELVALTKQVNSCKSY